MHRGLPCSKKMLESAKLHKVVPQAPPQQPSPWVKNLHATVLTCHDNFINEFEQDFDSNCSIEVLLLGFIFFLDRSCIYKNNRTSFMNFV
jgi:hypothetical protein